MRQLEREQHRMPSSAPSGPASDHGEGVAMADPVEFKAEITLSRGEVFDIVARCEEAVERAEMADAPELAFVIEGVRRFLLGRLAGSPGGLDE